MVGNSNIPVRAVGAPSAWQVVRRAALKDLDSLVPFAGALGLSEPQFPSTAAQVYTLLERRLLAWGSRLIVAELWGQVVGFCAYATQDARVRALYVAEASRGRGLGRELLAFAEQDLARAGAAGLRVAVAADNPSAQAFLTRLGYCPVGQPGHSEWHKVL
jgi:ribosomal protein S18 acetylase RimI-like enzyme